MGRVADQPGGLNRYAHDLAAAQGAQLITAGGGSLIARVARVTAEVWKADADLVDAHFALYALVPILGPARRLPLVVHFQGPWAAESASSGRGAIAVRRAVERAVYRRAREVVVLSEAFKEIVVRDYGVSAWRVHVIAPGVDLSRFVPGSRDDARLALGLPADAWVAVAVRRLVPRMGLDVLMEAWRSMPPSALLLVAGDGPVAVSGPGVRRMGRVSDEDLVACYQAADVSVVPSVALEGFGMVVLESLACGTPAVVTDVGGLPEGVRGLSPDLVVRAGSPRELADRLAAPMPSRAACRAHAEQFTWTEAARRVAAVYERARHPESRPRVVIVDHTARLSGGELAMARMAAAITDADVHVILGEDGPLVEELHRGGVSVEVLPMDPRMGEVHRNELRRAPAVSAARYTCQLAARLRRLRPDVVHTNSLKAALYGGVAGRLAGVPVVWHVRDRIADDYLPAGVARMIRQLAGWLPSGLVFNSRATEAALGRAGRVVPSPVDDRMFAVVAEPHLTPTIGMVGRIAPWKGQHVFLDALDQVAVPVAGVIVGSAMFGEDAYEQQLRARADGTVEFTGFERDVAAQLSRFDVLVHASTTPEPFGVAVVEGMAAGLPVIASDAGGPSEVIEDGRTGVLVPPGDSSALAAAITALLADPLRRRTLGANARAAAEAYQASVVAAEMVDVWRSATELSGRRR